MSDQHTETERLLNLKEDEEDFHSGGEAYRLYLQVKVRPACVGKSVCLF